jgi:hypothetical protein
MRLGTIGLLLGCFGAAPAATADDEPVKADLGTPSKTAPATPTVPMIHGGTLVFGEGVRLQVSCDPAAGKLTFRVAPETDAPKALGAPALLLATSEGPRTVTSRPAAGAERAWEIVDRAAVPFLADARVRVAEGGKSLEAPLRLEGPNGGSVAVLGEDAARLELSRDVSRGSLTVRLLRSADRVTSAPEVSLQTAAGATTLVLAPGSEDGTWLASDPALRSADVRGTVAIGIGGRSHRSALPPTPASAPDSPAGGPSAATPKSGAQGSHAGDPRR